MNQFSNASRFVLIQFYFTKQSFIYWKLRLWSIKSKKKKKKIKWILIKIVYWRYLVVVSYADAAVVTSTYIFVNGNNLFRRNIKFVVMTTFSTKKKRNAIVLNKPNKLALIKRQSEQKSSKQFELMLAAFGMKIYIFFIYAMCILLRAKEGKKNTLCTAFARSNFVNKSNGVIVVNSKQHGYTHTHKLAHPHTINIKTEWNFKCFCRQYAIYMKFYSLASDRSVKNVYMFLSFVRSFLFFASSF